jgi:hypothetical protein
MRLIRVECQKATGRIEALWAIARASPDLVCETFLPSKNGDEARKNSFAVEHEVACEGVSGHQTGRHAERHGVRKV